jgi:uncharacterized protein (UPF0276 family)
MSARLDLGVGIVALGGLDLFWSDISDLVDVVEVEPQTLWDEVANGWLPNAAATSWLRSIDRPLLAHGVGFPVGGQCAPDNRGVTLFAQHSRNLGALHCSEHLSFNRSASDGRSSHAGFLLPPRQTWSTVEAAVAHIRSYQDVVATPFLVESGVSYLRPAPNELDDASFLGEIVERADCGLLLDLHNLLGNERNGRQSVADVIDGLPLDRVLEVHVAGGFEYSGYWLDAHSGPCDDELMAILAATLPRLRNVRAVIFEALPNHLMEMGAQGLRQQLEAIHRIVDESKATRARSSRARRRIPPRRRSVVSEAEWQRRVIDYTTRRSTVPPDDDPGYVVLRELTDKARLGRIAVGARQTVLDLGNEIGIAGVQQLADDYLNECSAQVWTSAEADSFEQWVADRMARS